MRSIKISAQDLVAATTAQFRDITYVTDVAWDSSANKFVQTKKTTRILAAPEGDAVTTDITLTTDCPDPA